MYQDVTYVVEMITPSSQELNNIWTTLGGQYHPSIVCKIRRLSFDAGEISKTIRETQKTVIDM
ncbi:Pvc16 family protein [Dysgonomonas sp. 216]|uniref:Pvc16 family protein n=1 Tax=Dysgonomonas sp. 216 TaxID=2302934 RepID=UPI00351A9CF0